MISSSVERQKKKKCLLLNSVDGPSAIKNSPLGGKVSQVWFFLLGFSLRDSVYVCFLCVRFPTPLFFFLYRHTRSLYSVIFFFFSKIFKKYPVVKSCVNRHRMVSSMIKYVLRSFCIEVHCHEEGFVFSTLLYFYWRPIPDFLPLDVPPTPFFAFFLLFLLLALRALLCERKVSRCSLTQPCSATPPPNR